MVPLSPVRPNRNCKSTQLPDFIYSSYSGSLAASIASTIRLHEPSSYREVVCDLLRRTVILEELTTLHQTHTWDLVPLPLRKRPIGFRWIYKIKTKSYGLVERYKARLVVQGYTQEYDMDNEETFALVAKMTTVRALIIVTSIFQWKIFQMIVNNAFLNGDLHDFTTMCLLQIW